MQDKRFNISIWQNGTYGRAALCIPARVVYPQGLKRDDCRLAHDSVCTSKPYNVHYKLYICLNR